MGTTVDGGAGVASPKKMKGFNVYRSKWDLNTVFLLLRLFSNQEKWSFLINLFFISLFFSGLLPIF